MKLFRDIIFILTVVLSTLVGKTTKAANYFSFQQTTQQTDTTKKKGGDPEIDSKVEYAADDSTIVDKKRGLVYLYGNAKVLYEDFELQAEYIRYDFKNEIIFARGVKNTNGKYYGRPIFKSKEQGTGIADSIYFDKVNKTGNIYGIYTAQQGGFFSGGKAKVQPDDEIHLKAQTFSTCNLPHPHFGVFITKGIATETQYITGPVYLKIEDIPMPIGLPFGFFPKPNKKTSGFILPTPNQDATRGFSLNNGGYYLAFNDYLDGRLIGNVFTNGSYDVTLTSRYLSRYKYSGGLRLGFSSVRNGLEGTPQYRPINAFNITWDHSQNQNANPGTTFTASVNAGTSSYYRDNGAVGTYDLGAISQNTLSSSIAYGKVFGNGLFNFNSAFRSNQDTRTKAISLSLPEISLNMSTINPFDSKNRVEEQKWYQKITMGYSMQASNTVNTQENLLFSKGGLNRFNNGVAHSIPINMAFNVLNYFNFNANASYSEKWYFQSVNQRRFLDTDSVARDTVRGFKRAGEYNIGMSMSTKIYGTKQFRNMGRLKAIRHVMTPNVSFSYKPDFSAEKYGYYNNSYYYENDIRPGRGSQRISDIPIRDANGRLVKYSIFDGSQFGGPSMGEQANLSFAVDNNVELKMKSKKDTTGAQGDKKVQIIQGLTFTGTYNFLAAERKLSPIAFNGRSQFTEKLGINFGGTLNPYIIGQIQNPSFGGLPPTFSLGETNRYVFSEGKLPRLTNFNFSFDYSFNPAAAKKRNRHIDNLTQETPTLSRTPEQMQQLEAISRDPNAFVDFNIPWNLSFSYSFNYTNMLSRREDRRIVNVLSFSGDLAITPKTKVQYTSGWDFDRNTISPTSFTIYRDLHCWSMSAHWIPFGGYQSYSVTIQVKEAILQDLKLSKRKGFYTRY
ncbi:MAG: LPS-assembly protein LptD [Pedobacter sp.]|nr:MAG: LPS-assembly protein LptD [Pedobacter sp.]